jgi:superfamily II RNA helicase
MSSLVEIWKGDFVEEIKLPIEYPFELDHFQLYTAKAISNGFNCLVVAHTGCGKTVCAELAIAYHLLKGGKIIYASPIKTLSNQKLSSFSKKFPSVGLITGDIQMNQDGDVLIMTTEILHNIINSSTSKETLLQYGIPEYLRDSITCVIFDEVHYMNDPERGKVWSTLITLLNPTVQLIMLSATVSHPEEFASWISSIKNIKTIIIPTEKRIVPLRHYVLLNDCEYLIQDENDVYYQDKYDLVLRDFSLILKKYYKDHPGAYSYNNIHALNQTVNYLFKHNKLSAIFFCFNRLNCEKFANLIEAPLIEPKEASIALHIFDELMIKKKKNFEHRKTYHNIRALISKGIAYHHGGIAPIIKDAIEYLFENQYIKILFATETFAAGVDMPTRTVVFCGLIKPTNHGKRCLTTPEYKQMAGRAGRRGKDLCGNVYIAPVYELINRFDMKNMISGSLPVLSSQLKFDYDLIFSIGLNKSLTLEEFLNSSLHIIQIKKQAEIELKDLNERYSKLTKPDYKDLNDLLDKLYHQYLDEKKLIENNFEIDHKTSVDAQLNKLSKTYPDIKVNFNFYKGYYDESNKIKSNITLLQNKWYGFEKDILDFQLDLLIKNNYIELSHPSVNVMTLTDKDFTPKGIIAGHIKDCNSIILSTMLFNDVFTDLNVYEIIALMAVFIDDLKMSESIERINRKKYVVVPSNIHKAIDVIEEIIDYYTDCEDTIYIHRTDLWKISYEFIEIAYEWAIGKSINEIEDKLESSLEYRYDIQDGSFIKSMLRLSNMIKTLEKIALMKGDLALVKKLENAENIILRSGKDIVSVDSLYIENTHF